MASLQLLDSDGSGYSESFEIEEESLASSTNSGTTGAVLSQLKASLNSTYDADRGLTPGNQGHNASKKKPPLSGQGRGRAGSHEHIDFNRTIRSPINGATGTAVKMKGQEGGSIRSMESSKFKAAAHKVHSMQSASKRFSDSTELRDTVYNGWLAEKSAKISSERRSKQQAKREEEMKQRKKEMELSERAVRAVEEWSATKEIELRKKKKERLKQVKLKHQETEELEQKKRASKSVCEKWRERKTQELISNLKQKRRKESEEQKQKEEEELEKAQSAKQAFNVWNDRKAERSKEERKKKREQTRKLELAKQEQTTKMKEESEKVVDAWKRKKTKELSKSKQGNTASKTVHTRSWYPARSMKYTYPKDPRFTTNDKDNSETGSASENGSTHLDSTYSVSFDSDDSSDESDLLSLSTGDEDNVHVSSPKGKRRTIQVCCQVLEYWCTCEDSI